MTAPTPARRAELRALCEKWSANRAITKREVVQALDDIPALLDALDALERERDAAEARAKAAEGEMDNWQQRARDAEAALLDRDRRADSAKATLLKLHDAIHRAVPLIEEMVPPPVPVPDKEHPADAR